MSIEGFCISEVDALLAADFMPTGQVPARRLARQRYRVLQEQTLPRSLILDSRTIFTAAQLLWKPVAVKYLWILIAISRESM